MRKQRNMAQMKEQKKTPEEDVNKMEISNLSDADFKTSVHNGNTQVHREVEPVSELQGYND